MPAHDHRLHHRRHGAVHCRLHGPSARQPIDSLAATGAILAGVWSENPMPMVDSLGEEFLQAVKTGDPITVTVG
nr:hypothetical protein [Fournierella massiliensis]